jgi:hypothetical protein
MMVVPSSRATIMVARNLPRRLDTRGLTMAAETDWRARATTLIKGQLDQRGVAYPELVERLASIGVVDTEHDMRTRVERGLFTAMFFLQVMEAIGSSVQVHHEKPQQPLERDVRKAVT